MIKAIFFDIDGTLVSFKTHRVPQSTIDAIREVRKKGVKVFIATGRPMPFVDNLGEMEYDGIMTVNGAECQTVDGTVIRHEPIDRADLLRLIDYNKQYHLPIAFASNDDTFITTHSEKSKEVFDLLGLKCPRVAPIESCLDTEVMQIIAFFDVDTHPRLMTEVLSGCEEQRWHPYFADVIKAGNNKAQGIDYMIKHYGISLEETMAFGDGGNDITMLQHVGLGVAMGNARDAVKKVARYVTTHVDEEGIVNALNKFIE